MRTAVTITKIEKTVPVAWRTSFASSFPEAAPIVLLKVIFLRETFFMRNLFLQIKSKSNPIVVKTEHHTIFKLN